MKNLIFIFFITLSAFAMSAQSILDNQDLSLPFSWESKWDQRFDFQILSPNDSVLISSLTKVADNFWQQEQYDLEGNWLDTYRYFTEESGLVRVYLGENSIDERDYQNNLLSERRIAEDGKLQQVVLVDRREGRIERVTLKDSLRHTEQIYVYDSINNELLLKIKEFEKSDLKSVSHYTYTTNKLTEILLMDQTAKPIERTLFEYNEEGLLLASRKSSFQDSIWQLNSFISFNYFDGADQVKSTSLLIYSKQGNCIESITYKYNHRGDQIEFESIDLINGNWQLQRTYYQNSEAGGIVLGR